MRTPNTKEVRAALKSKNINILRCAILANMLYVTVSREFEQEALEILESLNLVHGKENGGGKIICLRQFNVSDFPALLLR